MERLVLANPGNQEKQVNVERPPVAQRPPMSQVAPPAEANPPQTEQPWPRVGYVDTNSINSTPKNQWPKEYPDGMPSWFKDRNNQSNQ